ncbi:MAG: formylglycine-generating enzyme family protein [Saprospiraceae bacterium]
MEKENLNIKIVLPNGFSFEMVFVEGGRFRMGNETGRDREKPAHDVRLSSYYMSEYAVTQDLWESVMGNNPSHFKAANRPVEKVSWEDTQQFIINLYGATGKSFRLPTEAEWEYAAIGGQYNQGYKYSGSDKLSQVGWYSKNSKDETQEVGQLLANELGLYDMSGNVLEWCEDGYDGKFYEKCEVHGVVENPVNDKKAAYRVLRGGSYFFSAGYCRPLRRFWNTPGDRDGTIGFRLVLSFQSVG